LRNSGGERAEFKEIVAKAWETERVESNPISCWQNKIRKFRKLAKGWSANVVSKMNKQKQSLVAEYDCLDLEAETRVLEDVEKVRMQGLFKELEKIWAIEEIKIRHRSMDRTILEGDRNFAYFHAVAHHRHRKKRIE
jgi:hypothetical protein